MSVIMAVTQIMRKLIGELRSPALPQDVIDNCTNRFFIFFGYPRSGHTILGALVDAHPNMVISHQYNPCVKSHLSNNRICSTKFTETAM